MLSLLEGDAAVWLMTSARGSCASPWPGNCLWLFLIIYVKHKVVGLEWTVDWMKMLHTRPVLNTSETSDGLCVVSNKLWRASPVSNAESNTGHMIDNTTLMLQNYCNHFNCCIIRCPKTPSSTIMQALIMENLRCNDVELGLSLRVEGLYMSKVCQWDFEEHLIGLDASHHTDQFKDEQHCGLLLLKVPYMQKIRPYLVVSKQHWVLSYLLQASFVWYISHLGSFDWQQTWEIGKKNHQWI